MKKRLTGIELRPQSLSAIELTRSGKSFVVSKTANIDFDDGEDDHKLPGAVRQLLSREGFSRKAAFAIAPPDNCVFFNQVNTALPHVNQIRSVLKSQIEDSVPLPFEDIVADIGDHVGSEEGQGQRNVLAVAMNRSKLTSILNAFEGAGVQPDIVTPAVSALHTVAKSAPIDINNENFVLLHFDQFRTFMVFYKKGVQVLVRTMNPLHTAAGNNPLSRDLALGWRRVFGFSMPEDAQLLISADDTHSSDVLNEIVGQKYFVSLDSMFKPAQQLGAEQCVPASLAILAKENERPNFVRSLEDERNAVRQPVGYFITAGIMLLLLIGVAATRLWVTLDRLESINHEIDKAIEEQFRKVMPEESLLFPVDQLRNETEKLRQQRENIAAIVGKQNNPVSLLSVFNQSIPEGYEIEIDRIIASANSMEIEGEAGSFGQAEEIPKILDQLEYFDDVNIDLSSRSGTSKVGFKLKITVHS